jgi:periodic tryptophan protein 1
LTLVVRSGRAIQADQLGVDADDHDGGDSSEEEGDVNEGGAADAPSPAADEELDQYGLPKSLRMDMYDDEDGEAQLLQGEDEDDDGEDLEGPGPEGDEEEEEEDDDDDDDEDDDEGAMEEAEDDGDEDGQPWVSDAMRDVRDVEDDDDEDLSDVEDHCIRPTDAVLLSASVEDEEYAALEVHVYEEDTGNLYVHHDIGLPAFPLCMAWGDCPPRLQADGKGQSGVGSFLAVGTFRPGIEIWDLDVIDPLEPVAVLGGERDPTKPLPGEAEEDEEGDEGAEGEDRKKKKDKGKKKKKRKGRRDGLVPGSHSDAVLSLSWNSHHRQVLASGSADNTVKIWDVTTQVCSHTCTHHTDKVAAVEWHPVEVGHASSRGGYVSRS